MERIRNDPKHREKLSNDLNNMMEAIKKGEKLPKFEYPDHLKEVEAHIKDINKKYLRHLLLMMLIDDDEIKIKALIRCALWAPPRK